MFFESTVLEEFNGEDLEIFRTDFLARLGAPEPSPKFQLNLAAYTGDLSRVNYLLRKGADINSIDQCRLTPLHCAVMNKQVEVVRTLVDRGAELNVEFDVGATPLACANEAGSMDMVKILVENGANIHTISADDFTLLHDAAICGFQELVLFFIDKGIDVNASCQSPNKQGITPLHLALMSGHDEIAKVLIRKGANVNICGTFITDESKKLVKNVSPLLLALQRGEKGQEIANILMKVGADTNAKSSSKLTALHLSCLHGFLDFVQLLLKNECDVNCKTDSRATPLFFACQKNHHEIVAALLNVKDINVNCYSSKSGAPIHQAAYRGHFKILKLLVDKGADINSKSNEFNHTPLLAAIAGRRLKTCEFLVKNGADIHARGPSNVTSLSLACSHASFHDFAKKLIKLGVDVNAKMKGGWTALHRAIQQKNLYSVNILIENGADVNAQSDKGKSVLHEAVKWGDASVLNLLISKGANVNVATNKGITPLKLAEMDKKKDIAELLLKKGASRVAKLNATKTVSLATPFLGAISNGDVEEMKILLSNNADIRQVTHMGNTLLHIAVHQKNTAIVSFLLQHVKQLGPVQYKDFINAKTVSNGTTALHIAAENNDVAAVKLLLEHGATFNLKNHAAQIASQLSKDESVKAVLNTIETLFKRVKEHGDDEASEFTNLDKASMNARDREDGGTFLYWLLSKGHIDNVIFMINSGADYSMITDEGSTLLNLASLKGNSEFIKALLARVKSDDPSSLSSFVNVSTTADGTVALHIASSIQVAKVLLHHGAFYNKKNKAGHTPFNTTKNISVKNLLHVVNELFDDAKNGKSVIIDKVKLLEAEEPLFVYHIRNNKNHSLLQVLRSNDHKQLASKLSKILK